MTAPPLVLVQVQDQFCYWDNLQLPRGVIGNTEDSGSSIHGSNPCGAITDSVFSLRSATSRRPVRGSFSFPLRPRLLWAFPSLLYPIGHDWPFHVNHNRQRIKPTAPNRRKNPFRDGKDGGIADRISPPDWSRPRLHTPRFNRPTTPDARVVRTILKGFGPGCHGRFSTGRVTTATQHATQRPRGFRALILGNCSTQHATRNATVEGWAIRWGLVGD